MRKKAVAKRFRVTRKGKVLRRAMSQGHFLAKVRTAALKRRKHLRSVNDIGKKIAKKYL